MLQISLLLLLGGNNKFLHPCKNLFLRISCFARNSKKLYTSIHGDILVASTAASCKKHSPATKSLTLQTFLLNEKKATYFVASPCENNRFFTTKSFCSFYHFTLRLKSFCSFYHLLPIAIQTQSGIRILHWLIVTEQLIPLAGRFCFRSRFLHLV